MLSFNINSEPKSLELPLDQALEHTKHEELREAGKRVRHIRIHDPRPDYAVLFP